MPIIATCFRVLILCCIVTQTGELACRLFYRLLHGLLQCLLLRLGHCGLCAALSCFKERCIYRLRTTATAALLFTSFIVQVKTCFVMNSGNCCLSVSIWESRRYLVQLAPKLLCCRSVSFCARCIELFSFRPIRRHADLNSNQLFLLSFCPFSLHHFFHTITVPLALRAAIVLVVPLLDTRHWIQSCRLNLAIRRASGDFGLAPPFPLIVRKGTERGYLLNHPFGHPVATPVASLFWICATSFKVLFRIACAVPYTQHGLPSLLLPYLPPRFIWF